MSGENYKMYVNDMTVIILHTVVHIQGRSDKTVEVILVDEECWLCLLFVFVVLKLCSSI